MHVNNFVRMLRMVRLGLTLNTPEKGFLRKNVHNDVDVDLFEEFDDVEAGEVSFQLCALDPEHNRVRKYRNNK